MVRGNIDLSRQLPSPYPQFELLIWLGSTVL